MNHAVQAQATAGFILHRGAIITMDQAAAQAEAIAVRGGRIVAVGRFEELRQHLPASTRCLDLQGRTVVPGFVDAHAHLDREGLKELFPSLTGVRSIAEVQQRIASEAKRRPAGSWIITMPLGEPPFYFNPLEGLAEGRWPTRRDLDAAAPDHPVYIRAPWGFWTKPPIVSIANSRALQLCGITAQTRPPLATITIELDEQRREPTGVFREQNYFPLVELTMMPQVPRFSLADRVEGLRRSMARYAEAGVTTVYEGHGLAPELLDAYARLTPEEMRLRCHLVRSAPWDSPEEAARELADAQGGPHSLEAANHWLRVDGLFLPIVGNRALIDLLRGYLPYTGWAGFLPHLLEEEEYERFAEVAVRYGQRINTIEGWKSDRLLEIWEGVARRLPRAQPLRHVLVHLRKPSEAAMRKMQAQDVVVTTVPFAFLWKDAEKYAGLPEEEQEIVPHRSLLEHGVHFAMGTDNCPVNPFAVMWSAVTRRERMSGAVLGPRQRLRPWEALRAMTADGAYLCGRENELGRLAAGMLADFVVLDENPLTVAEDDLPRLRPVVTVSNGKVSFAAPGTDLGEELRAASATP
ncbi:MAG: amidohydrolase [Candidatus Tectomicrobia bacterium]|nr:amidohydrolase [Candidatus Tectomicrobia bacterium]